MIRRRRRDSAKMIVYGSVLGIVVLLLLVIVGLLIVRNSTGSDAALTALVEASSESKKEEVVEPWSGKQKDAILLVKRTASERPEGSSIDQLVFDGELAKRVVLYNQLGLGKGVWNARKVSGRSLYWVSYENVFMGVTIGPRWLVQVDPKGTRPTEYARGVIPANALAELLMVADPDKYTRYLNKTDAVLDVLLKHKFANDVQLSSAILIYFSSRNKKLQSAELYGWAVIPRRVDIDKEVLYDAFFQWKERERLQVAHFEVDLSKQRFEARNLLANQIVADSGNIKNVEIVDIRPKSLKLDMAPSRESDPMVRALRYILANDQLITSVGALLSYKAQSGNFSYDGWRIEPDDCDECTVSYRFSEGEKHDTVSWTVSPRGAITPESPIAEMAMRAVSVAAPMDASTQANKESDESSQ